MKWLENHLLGLWSDTENGEHSQKRKMAGQERYKVLAKLSFLNLFKLNFMRKYVDEYKQVLEIRLKFSQEKDFARW